MAEGFADTPRFRLIDAPPLARFVLRAPEAARKAAGKAYGLALPEMLNRGASIGERGKPGARVALHLGPDEWWLIVPEAEGPEVFGALEKALAAHPHSLVEISHRQVGYVLEGEGAASLLNAGCPLDLSETAFPPGMATRSLFHRVGLMIWRMAPATFRLEIDRSLAPYFVASLAESARDHN
ncbi:MAG: sarcosine oxidase subunit gamma [Beijerinckiaceae bacterium]|nr:sarcosine oxidase subunit gamma [Beijerinckiaceae bacterium]